MSIAGKKLGRDGESVATSFLEKNGYKISEKNFAFKNGEIDIIAESEGVIHFVEVKTRKSVEYGTPAMAVDNRKQAKIIKVAEHYLTMRNTYDAPCSFDVMEVFKFKDGHYAINHIENAFEG